MKELTILADDVRVQANGNQVEVSMYKPEIDFSTIPYKEIFESDADLYELFASIIEYDEFILHQYLRDAGYIYNKG